MRFSSCLPAGLLVAAIVTAGCNSSGGYIECRDNSSCGLRGGGVCTLNDASGNQFCAYPDVDCPSGMRWSDLDVEDDISGQCVGVMNSADAAMGGQPDAIPGDTTDAGIDAMPEDGAPGCRPRVLFRDGAAGAMEVYSAFPDGSGVTNLSNNAPSDDAEAAWSPDGSKIAFRSRRDGNDEIYIANADGSGADNLTEDPGANDSQPAFAPNGNRIAWRKGSRLWVMDTSGANRREVSTLTLSGLSPPVWMPDGSAILVASAGDIYRVPAAGGMPTNLTNTPGLVSENDPQVSPAGDKIIYSRGSGSGEEVYVMGSDGSSPTNITNNAGADGQPSWAPDGELVAFSSERDGNAEVYTMAAAGGSPSRLTNNPGTDRRPVWSPDGQFIAFTRSVSGPSVSVVVMRRDGTMQMPFNVSDVAGDVSWSPCLR